MTRAGPPVTSSDRYSVTPPTGVCATTGRAFVPGDAYVAALVDDGGDGPLRRADFDAGAWDAGARPSSGQVFATWRCVTPKPEEKHRRVIGDDQLMDIFEQMDDGIKGRAGVFRYLVALMLVRRRRLVIEGRAGDALRVRQVLPGGKDAQGGARAFVVHDPVLDEDAITQATDELAVLISQPAGNKG